MADNEETPMPVEAMEQPTVSVEADGPTTPEETIVSIEELLATADLGAQYITLPEPYKGGIRVRPLTMAEMNAAQKSALHKKVENGRVYMETNSDELNKLVMCMSLVEPALTPAQYDGLMNKNYKLMLTLLAAMQTVNGVTIDDVKGVMEEVMQQFRG